jgi:type VI secretion system protein VasD
VAYETDDFFSLYQRPKEALSPDMVMLEVLELRPGEQREMKLSVQPGSRYVGVLAAYRDLPESNWRVVIPLQEQERNSSVLTLDALGIKAQDDASKEEE